MKKSLLLCAALAVASSAFAQDLDVYVIGDNVNGNRWMESDPSGKMTYVGNGEYIWEGETLGTGFKLNDGSWNNGEHNWGSNGSSIERNVPYFTYAAGDSSDIQFADCTLLNNPTVKFNATTGELTIDGEPEGKFHWYVTGLNNCWDMDEAHELVETENEGVFEIKNFAIEASEEAYGLRIAMTGWAQRFGSLAEDAAINNENLALELEEVFGEDGKVPTMLAGTFDIIWDLNEQLVTFVSAGGGVEGIAVDENAPVYYYNLQGVRVENPTKGIVVKVRGNQAEKIFK